MWKKTHFNSGFVVILVHAMLNHVSSEAEAYQILMKLNH